MSFLKSFPPPGAAEGLQQQQQPDTEAGLNAKGLGTGTLYITESHLSWLDGSGLGFSLQYPTISLHAVSRDLNAYSREHLYVMVDAKFEGIDICTASQDEELSSQMSVVLGVGNTRIQDSQVLLLEKTIKIHNNLVKLMKDGVRNRKNPVFRLLTMG
uniref:Methylosome subunit pICln n=1 Tax=Rhinolophus ferrumequinum TaxID=59479 RepID=A0A671E2D4_RHIFE